jgi:hypothetical protein
VLLVPVEQRPVCGLVRAQPATHLDDHHTLIAVADLMLGA